MFKFEIKNTASYRALKISSFPLLKYAGFISWLFLYLFLFSLVFLVFSALGLILFSTAVKMAVIALFVCIFFIEAHLFNELKIKKFKVGESLEQAVLNPEKFNMADFLNLESVKIIKSAVKLSKKMGLLEVSSMSIFYAALTESKDIQILIFRLGVDLKKISSELKNYLEKQQRQKGVSIDFSESFKKVILSAAVFSKERGRKTIGEKEILVALSNHDEFFKKVLIDGDLKEKDVEVLSLWLDNVENNANLKRQFWLKENLARFGSLGKDFASGFTVTLDQFAVDWTDFARKNAFGEVVGHEKETDRLESVLAKPGHTGALIIGEEGVGKKRLVESLSERCYLGTGLPELKDKKVVELDMVALISRIQDQEVLESTLDRIFGEVLSSGNVILIIDRLDDFVNPKIEKPGEVDISIILSKYLAIQGFKFVGITTFDGLHRKLEQSPSFLGHLSKIEVSEMSEFDTIRVLQNLAIALEQKYKMLITYPSIREIINLTARYLPSSYFPKKAIDVLQEAVVYVNSKKEKVVLPLHIAEIISDKTQIPIGKLEFKEKSVLMNLENLIHQRIINQKDAVDEISTAMRRARAGISSSKRPMGSFLFLGPTGVGKTETSKALAEIYFGSEDKMIRLDMSEFQSISDIQRLIGSISPVEQQGLLTTPVRENPFSLVLLDEMEKAHPNILNLFLQVLDEGHLTDGQGRKVVFSNTIIIGTSNAGSSMIFKAVELGEKLEKRKLLDSLFEQKVFSPEFINRFDAVVIFNPLTKENLTDIADLMLGEVAKNLKEKEIDFLITDQLKEKIVELSYKPEFGAREMRRVVQDKIENEIAKNLISDSVSKGDKIEINPDNFKIVKIAS